MTEQEIIESFSRVSNWGRWGPDDQRGTLNFITQGVRRRALGLAREGLTVSCALPIDTSVSPGNRNPQMHMIKGGDIAPEEGYGTALDYIGFAPHGPGSTHLDALCHVFFDRKMYNGYPSSLVTSAGARKNAITVAEEGIVTRGILLDIPMVRGVEYVEPDDPPTRAELEEAERRAGVRAEEGDAVMIRLGRHTRAKALGPAAEFRDGHLCLPGLYPDCLGWLHERGIALLGSDAAHDVLPTPYPRVRNPIHVGALVYMGLHLLDNALLDDLAQACAKYARWEFLFTLAPLRIGGATCSPVNPIAVL